MALTSSRLSAAVLGVALAAGVTAGPALAVEPAPTAPVAAFPAATGALTEAVTADVAGEVDLRVFGPDGQEIVLPEDLGWTSDFGWIAGTGDDFSYGDDLTEVPDLTEAPDLTEEEWAAVEEVFALWETDPDAELTAEQEALLERIGWYDDPWAEFTDEETALLEELLLLWETDPSAEPTPEQQALLERLGWDAVSDPAEWLTEEELAALERYGDSVCLFAGDTLVFTLGDVVHGELREVDEEALAIETEWTFVAGLVPCEGLTAADLAAPETLRIETTMDGMTQVVRVLITDPELLAEFEAWLAAAEDGSVPDLGSDETLPAAGSDTEPAPGAPVAEGDETAAAGEEHVVPSTVETGVGVGPWAALAALLAGAGLVGVRRSFTA
ncbi:hypothetical protein [Micrococcus endophyticus]|uniref:hypothetical protein n=1 Tax=Micrococcus endophyticus TaxID=455343 RepID=UPI0034CF7EBA